MSILSGLPVAARCRVIVDNDWTGDPDGLVALAHHLLSPGNRVVAVTSSMINPIFDPPPTAAADGAALARELVDLVGGAAQPPVHAGSETAFGDGGAASAASEAIVAEALRDDPLPLYLVCAGPLTNVAAALRRGSGRLGAWLWERFTSLPLPDFVELGELWPLGDSPPVLVTALGSGSSAFTTSSPSDDRGPRRVYTDVDVRLLVGDLLAKLRLHERRTEGQGTR